MGDIWAWLGNAGTKTWDWGKKAGGQALDFAWNLPGYAARQAQILSEQAQKALGKSIKTTQETAAGQQLFLGQQVSMTNVIILALGAGLLIALFAKK